MQFVPDSFKILLTGTQPFSTKVKHHLEISHRYSARAPVEDPDDVTSTLTEAQMTPPLIIISLTLHVLVQQHT